MQPATMAPSPFAFTFAFPDMRQAADFLTAFAKTFAEMAQRSVAAPPPSNVVSFPTPAAPAGDSPGNAGLKELLDELPPLSSVPTVPDNKPAKALRKNKKADYQAPLEPVAPTSETSTLMPSMGGPAVTLDDVRAAGRAVLGPKGENADKIADILASYGVQVAKDVPEAQWPELLQRLKAVKAVG
jgi:hypothetical protein